MAKITIRVGMLGPYIASHRLSDVTPEDTYP
jgi:hypothetical protein